MKKITSVLKYFLLALLLAFLIFTLYSNYKLNQDIKSLRQGIINVSMYGTTTDMAGQPNSRNGFQSSNTLYPSLPTVSTFPMTANLLSTFSATESEELLKNQIKYEEEKDQIIGCYFKKENINERIQISRNNYFTQFVEGNTKYVPISGSAQISLNLKEIYLIPDNESKFTLVIVREGSDMFLKEKTGILFQKQSCVDFYTN